MDNLIRTDTVFGKRVNMVGSISADLVLESLGKIYIKSRNKSLTLEELITSLALSDPNTSTSRVKIVEGIEGLDTSEFKEGTFVFDKLSNILYLFIDGELMELVNVAPEGTGYVKRSGDTMTGRLAIYVKDGPPLYVNSAVLVPNLNAEYLNGETAETFTRRHKDEKISGSWTFKAPTYFNSNIKAEKDIVINGSIGSPNFASGFGGYGWRMDADTNTLTVDNLVVRKLMKVYELVVNKISATNGSLWVSNAGKVVSAVKLDIKPYEFFNAANDDYLRYIGGLRMGDALIKMPENPTLEDLEEEAFATASGDGIVTRDCYNSTTLANMKFIDITVDKPNLASNQGARFNPVFETGFRFDCTFPIITRNDKQTYDTAYELVQYYRDTLSGLILAKAAQESIDSVLNSLELAQEDANPRKYVSLIRSYYKYFAGGDYYYVRFDDNNLPVFKAGDLLRCQKWTNGGIKYYDALVCNYIGKGYILLLAPSFLDKKTTIEYDNSLSPKVTVEEESRNLDLYKTTRNYKEPDLLNYVYNDDGTTTIYTYDEALDNNLMGIVEVNDSLVLIGHLWDKQRQNAVYITSTDDAAPYMDVLSGINRPDYSVNYHIPVYKTIKLFQRSYSLTTFVGFNNLVDIPYTGDYYVLDSSIEDFTCEYVCFKHNNTIYLAKGKTLPQAQGVSLQYYLNIVPDKCTSLGEPTDNFYINLEDGGHISLEDNSGSIIQERQYKKLTLESTKTVKARLGNLDGIQDELFPIDKQPCGYGLYGQNVYLTGEFFLSNGQAVADLGKDAMAFAIASSREGNAAINLLRADLVRADNLIKASHYNKGTLKTAGMYIGNDAYGYPGIIIWGNKILFATTDLEFSGKVQPTMLLADGKIQGKYLGVDEAHGTVDALVLPSEFTIKNGNTETKYTSSDPSPGTVRVYRPKVKNVTSDGTVYYTETDQIFYVRRFMVNNDSSQLVWLLVNPDGYPQNKNNFGEYTSIDYPNITYYDENNSPITYSSGILPAAVESDFVTNYTTPLKVWSLEKNGRGNVGGATLYWNSIGKVVVSGILYSNEGNIGGLNLGDSSLFTLAKDSNDVAFNPILISSTGYGYNITENNNKEISLPYILLNSLDLNDIVRDRVVLTSRGLFYLGATLVNTSSTKWNDFLSCLVPGILFSLTIIPVYLENKSTWTLYARHSCGLNVFLYIYVTFGEGSYAIDFELMDATDPTSEWYREREWFLERLVKGLIHFITSGINSAVCSSSGTDVFDFDVEYMYSNGKSFSINNEEYIKATISTMSFNGVNHAFNPNHPVDYSRAFSYSAKIARTEDRSLWGELDSGGLFEWGYKLFSANTFKHFMLIETSDDSSPNWGGFNLTALYIPTFDSRFISSVEDKHSEYDENTQLGINDANSYRILLINLYGTGGTYPTSLEASLQTKINGMTSELQSSLSSVISSIRTDIQSMTSYADGISVGSDMNSLEAYASNLNTRYNTISTAINNLESGLESTNTDFTLAYWDTGLPIVIIDTGGREVPAPNEDWLENVSIKIYQNRETLLYESETLSFRGRGNSTWRRDKKPYALKLEKKAEILGMSSHKRWCLLANYLDRTLMRNDIAFKLGNATDLSWTPHGKFVEVVLNGQHKGNYYLAEQIRVSTNRVNIDELDDFLLENDSYYDEAYKFTSSIYGYYYNIKSPDVEDETFMNEKLSFIESKINEIESLIQNNGNYEPYIDFDSFIDYWFVNEFAGLIELRKTRNTDDPGPHSMYCQYIVGSNGQNDKIKMGPIWDFDLFTFQESLPAAVNYNVPGLPSELSYDYDTDIQNFYIVDKKIVMDIPYYNVLFTNPSFVLRVKEKWVTIKPKFYNIINTEIDNNYNLLSTSEELNLAIWGLLGNSYHHPDGGLSFRDSIIKMKNVCNIRLDYMDSWINSL